MGRRVILLDVKYIKLEGGQESTQMAFAPPYLAEITKTRLG